jgi:hypothetical protein
MLEDHIRVIKFWRKLQVVVVFEVGLLIRMKTKECMITSSK